MTDRTVILHYRLLKNAATSLDRILQQNFPGKWVTREFLRNGWDNSAMVAARIAANPEAVAISSHTMLGPMPRVEGVRIILVLFLRDPVDRIVSAYSFERRQDSDSMGARLAKETDLARYVQTCLDTQRSRKLRSFQIHRLASHLPGEASELDHATAEADGTNRRDLEQVAWEDCRKGCHDSALRAVSQTVLPPRSGSATRFAKIHAFPDRRRSSDLSLPEAA